MAQNNKNLEQSLKTSAVYYVLAFVEDAATAMVESQHMHGPGITTDGLAGLSHVINRLKADLQEPQD